MHAIPRQQGSGDLVFGRVAEHLPVSREGLALVGDVFVDWEHRPLAGPLAASEAPLGVDYGHSLGRTETTVSVSGLRDRLLHRSSSFLGWSGSRRWSRAGATSFLHHGSDTARLLEIREQPQKISPQLHAITIGVPRVDRAL